MLTRSVGLQQGREQMRKNIHFSAAKVVRDAACRSYMNYLADHDISLQDLLVNDEEGFPGTAITWEPETTMAVLITHNNAILHCTSEFLNYSSLFMHAKYCLLPLLCACNVLQL